MTRIVDVLGCARVSTSDQDVAGQKIRLQKAGANGRNSCCPVIIIIPLLRRSMCAGLQSQFGLKAALRRRSGSSLNRVPKAAIPEMQMFHTFQRPDPILGHSAVGSGRKTNGDGMTALSPSQTCSQSQNTDGRCGFRSFSAAARKSGVIVESGHSSGAISRLSSALSQAGCEPI